MRISDWSSDVCSSDLCADLDRVPLGDTTRVGRFERQGKLRSGRTAAKGGDLSVLAMAEMPELALGKDQREFGVPRPFGAGIGHRWLTEPLQGFGIELDAAGRSRKTPHLARPLAGIAADRVLDREGQALRRRPQLRN